jgi:hypothetical protein
MRTRHLERHFEFSGMGFVCRHFYEVASHRIKLMDKRVWLKWCQRASSLHPLIYLEAVNRLENVENSKRASA